MTETPADALDRARRLSRLSVTELWLRYFELGGMNSVLEFEAVLHGALTPTDHDQDVIAVALNERFAELGADQRVPYSNERD